MSDDPLARLAKAAHQATQNAEREREAELEERRSGEKARQRLTRAVTLACTIAVLAGAGIYLALRFDDPYHGEDPLADPQRARAYVAGLLDEVVAYRQRHGGELPRSLDQAVRDSRLPPRGSPYRLEYRVEAGVPVLALQGGREPIVVRGAAR